MNVSIIDIYCYEMKFFKFLFFLFLCLWVNLLMVCDREVISVLGVGNGLNVIIGNGVVVIILIIVFFFKLICINID